MVRAKECLLAALMCGCAASAAWAQLGGGAAVPAPPAASPPPVALAPPPSFWMPDFVSSNECAETAHLTINFGGVFLQRSTPSAQALLVDPAAGTTLVDPSAFCFSMNGGPMLDVIWQSAGKLGLEISFFDVDSWQSKAAYPNSDFTAGWGDLNIDSQLSIPVTSANVLFSSKLYSGEIDIRYALGDHLTPMLGFRWIEFDDAYLASGQALMGNFMHLVQARNELVGLQLGLDAEAFDRSIPLQLGIIAKAGVYWNGSTMANNYADPTFAFAANANSTNTAFEGELALAGSYRFTRRLGLRAGYEVLWFSGLALAPSQIPSTNFGAGQATVNTCGSLFCHGAFASLEATW